MYCNDIEDDIRTNKIKALFQILEKLTMVCSSIMSYYGRGYKNLRRESRKCTLKVFKNPDNIWNNVSLLEKWENIKK